MADADQPKIMTLLDVIATNVQTIATDVAVLKTDVADLKTDVAVLKTDVADLKTHAVATDSAIAGLRMDLNAHRAETRAAFDRTASRAELAELREEMRAGFEGIDRRLARRGR